LPALVTTLLARLEAADALHAAGRFGSALTAYEDLIERAQERGDRAVEAAARSMAARCLLARGDLEGGRAHLQAAGELADVDDASAHARRHAARVRLAAHDPDLVAVDHALQAYLWWADEHDHPAALVDACTLAAGRASGAERATWLERAAHEAAAANLHAEVGRLFTDLGACLDGLGRLEDALEAYERALRQHEATGTVRQRVGSRWAAGEACLRLDDPASAQSHLEAAVRLAEASDDALDLLALALADLARVHEAAGDVVEARHTILRAARVGREQDLADLWPARWVGLVAFARTLDLDV
jgi:tetratricopeptide (TPR) repeat protein